MLVKFANAEVPVWKLRKGAILEYDGIFVHLVSVLNTTRGLSIGVEYDDGSKFRLLSTMLNWLEP